MEIHIVQVFIRRGKEKNLFTEIKFNNNTEALKAAKELAKTTHDLEEVVLISDDGRGEHDSLSRYVVDTGGNHWFTITVTWQEHGCLNRKRVTTHSKQEALSLSKQFKMQTPNLESVNIHHSYKE